MYVQNLAMVNVKARLNQEPGCRHVLGVQRLSTRKWHRRASCSLMGICLQGGGHLGSLGDSEKMGKLFVLLLLFL